MPERDKNRFLQLAVDNSNVEGSRFANTTGATGGGGGDGGGPVDSMIEERIKRSEAEAKVEQTKLDGKIDLVLAKLDALKEDVADTKKEVSNNKWQLATLGVALVALLIGVWAYSTQMTELAAGIASIENGQESQVSN